MRYYFVFLFAFLTHTVEAQIILPAYQGVQYKAGIAGCGTLTINHLAANGVAPVDKTVTYGTVTGIPGEPAKCWITRNLGASQQATAVNDATEASAGWYWQFDLKKGYKHDGTIATPTWSFASYTPPGNWSATVDPCTLELGAGWRIPTSTEWINIDESGGWAIRADQWNSGLKLHGAGSITSGNLVARGGQSMYWSSTYISKMAGAYNLQGSSGYSEVGNYPTSYAFPLRCIKD